jgi:hypothetical protein
LSHVIAAVGRQWQGWRQRRLGFLVGDQFDGAQQPAIAHIAHQRMERSASIRAAKRLPASAVGQNAALAIEAQHFKPTAAATGWPE